MFLGAAGGGSAHAAFADCPITALRSETPASTTFEPRDVMGCDDDVLLASHASPGLGPGDAVFLGAGACAAVVDEITKPDKLKWAEIAGKKVSEYKEGRPFEHYRKQTFPTASPTNSITFASEAMMRYKRPKECKRKDAKAAKGKGLTKITEAEACCGAKLGQMKWNREGEATKFFKARAFLGRANGTRRCASWVTAAGTTRRTCAGIYPTAYSKRCGSSA